jgi:hypothetical protein
VGLEPVGLARGVQALGVDVTPRPLFVQHAEAADRQRAAVQVVPETYVGIDGLPWPIDLCDIHWRPQAECGRARCSVEHAE